MLQFLIISNMKVSIDTRTIKKGEYFVPIKGPNFDGNKFINEALKKGAKGIITEKDFYKIAQDKITKIKPIIVAVAGSIGKSTFRSYLYSILKTKFDVLESDLNTKLGFSLKLVNELNRQRIIVAEIGIDRIGEMEKTASFIKPDISIITKLGKEHLQFFKSFKNVVIEESNIFKYTKIKDCYINSNDDEYYKKYGIKFKNAIYFNAPLENKIVENKIQKLMLPDHEIDYLRGIYRILKKYFEFSDQNFIKGLDSLEKPNGRLNVIYLKNGSVVVDDSYNAVCDETIIEGLKFAKKLSVKLNKSLNIIISTMRETGLSTKTQHKKVAIFLNNVGFDDLILFGDDTSLYADFLNKDCKTFKTIDDFDINPVPDCLYFIKSANYFKGNELVKRILNSV